MPADQTRVIYDPIHKVIPFTDSDEDTLLLDLINTKEFQRLRRIKQLGMSDMVFPGSSHTRFAHSIGVMQMARRFLLRVEQLVSKKDLSSERKIAILAAALLHDLGHGPFSHAFEKVAKKDHEERTLEIILSPDTEINQTLSKYDKRLPQSLEVFFIKEDDTNSEMTADRKSTKQRPKQSGIIDIPVYLKQIVSSQLDADRFDYLLRDSYATGAQYGSFDVDWLIQHLFLDVARNRFYLHQKSLYAAESYIQARYHMYQTVYFHKTTRAAEIMLQLAFDRYKSLIASCSPDQAAKIVPDAPSRMVKAFSGTMTLNDFLLLDDFSMWEFLKACRSSDDTILKELARGLVDRRLFKAFDMSTDDPYVQQDFRKNAEKELKKGGLAPEYFLENDTASDTPYRTPYSPGAIPQKQIFMGTPDTEKRELSDCSKSVKALSDTYHRMRYYFPVEARESLQKCLDNARKRGRK